MCEVFLLRDLGPFELCLRGDVNGAGAALAVSAVIDHLPYGSDIVVDLRQVSSLDLDATGSIVRQLERIRTSDALVLIVADDPWIARLLLGSVSTRGTCCRPRTSNTSSRAIGSCASPREAQ